MNKNILFLIVLFLAASCVTTKQLNYFQKPGMGIPKYADSVGYQEYRLQKGDYLYVKIYDVLQDNMELFNNSSVVDVGGDNAQARLSLYLVNEEGYFEFPYVGEIYALNKTTRELKYEMEEHLKELLSHFSVDVWLANRSFSIIGDGRSQRIQIPSEKLTIFQALALSGDMSLFSDRSKIKLVRQTEAGTIVKSFDLRPKSIINSEFYYIQPNDVLYVQHTFAKYFGIEHFTTAISATLGTVSFAIIMYRIGKTVKEKTDKNKPTAE